jgi:hypothetical protein
MAGILFSQNNQNSKNKRTRSEFLTKPHGDVLQDRSAPKRARAASIQASPLANPTRAHRVSKNSDRVKQHSTSRKTVQVIAWASRPVSMQIDACAAEWHTTRSKAAVKLIELGLAHNLLRANLHLIVEVIRETLQEECRRFFGRLTSVIFRMYLLVFRIFHLQKNLLGRSGFQNRLTVAQLDKIIAWSGDLAREDVLRKTGARSAALDLAIADWLAAERISETEQKEETGKHN